MLDRLVAMCSDDQPAIVRVKALYGLSGANIDTLSQHGYRLTNIAERLYCSCSFPQTSCLCMFYEA